MPRVVVDVMPKTEILDPQGKAVLGALPRLGFEGVRDVRQGKRFELDFGGEITDEVLAEVAHIAHTLLSNPVIEHYTVTVEEALTSSDELPELPVAVAEPEPEVVVEPEVVTEPEAVAETDEPELELDFESVAEEPTAEEIAADEAEDLEQADETDEADEADETEDKA